MATQATALVLVDEDGAPLEAQLATERAKRLAAEAKLLELERRGIAVDDMGKITLSMTLDWTPGAYVGPRAVRK